MVGYIAGGLLLVTVAALVIAIVRFDNSFHNKGVDE